jgi:hypothetical protein
MNMEQKVDNPVQGKPDNGSDLQKLEAQHKGGANWFYWIAGLSLINSIVMLAGGQWGFVVGLGITQFADGIGAAVAEEVGAGIGLRAVVFLFDAFIAGLFVMFGIFAGKRQTWAFVTGMVLYAMDGFLFLLVADWLGVGFHVFVLFCLFGGLAACRKLLELERPADPALSSQPITP